MSRTRGKGARRLAALDDDEALFGRTETPDAPSVGSAAPAAVVEAVQEAAEADESELYEDELPPEPKTRTASRGMSVPGLELRKKPVKKKDSFYVTDTLSDRLRNATGWFQSQDYSVSKGDIVEAALDQYLSALEAQHNGGVPFPRYRKRLKQGVL